MKRNLKLLGYCSAIVGTIVLFTILGVVLKHILISALYKVVMFLKTYPVVACIIAIVLLVLFVMTICYAYKEDK